MKRRWSLLVLAPLFIFSGCGPGEPENVHFKGDWKHTVENGIANTKEESMVTATVDHERFRMVTKSTGISYIQVYDGTTLYGREDYAPADMNGAPQESASPTQVSAEPMSTDKAAPLRFWADAYRQGHGDPGGTIAGRDTILYKIAERRPDGEFSRQEWIDAKTGVLLKKMESIYSSQVNSMVRQETWECQTIDYSPPNESDFQKP